jgi:hypothetical protein
MEKINVAELLKDCPTGMELDCLMYDNVYFKCIREHAVYPIVCYTIDSKGEKEEITFSWYGKYALIDTAKCVIFPKGKTTWEGFQRPFKDGDILAYTSSYTTVFIYRNKRNEQKYATSFYVGHTIGVNYCNFHIYNKSTLIALNGDCDVRLATEEEKQKLFDAIKENGYKWNAETKTLAKLTEPNFKVGDKVRGKYTNNIYTISCITPTVYELTNGQSFTFNAEDCHELVHDKFDITTLIPFESRVLARYCKDSKWIPTFWGSYDKEDPENPYNCCGMLFAQCIPYEGNEYLLNTADDCDEYFKTWQ